MILPTKHKTNHCLSLWAWAMALFFTVSLGSCSGNIYDQTQELKDGVWLSADSITFEFDIQDTSKSYHIFLDVEHSTAYNYQNIYCLVESYSPQGQLVQRQLSSLELATRKGKWIGDCSEELCNRSIPFIIDTKFDVGGLYKIVLKQYTRTEKLEGLNSLRLQIREVE